MQRLSRRVKRRTRRRPLVLQGQELCTHFGIDADQLEAFLRANHSFSQGFEWSNLGVY